MIYARTQRQYWPILLMYIAIGVIVALALSFRGCTQTPQRQAFIGADAASDVVNGVSDAYVAKLITKAQLTALAPYADAVKKAQDDLFAAIKDGKVDISSYTTAVNDAVIELLNKEAAAKRVASTQPH